MSDIYTGTIEHHNALAVYSIIESCATKIDLERLQRTSQRHPWCQIDIYLGLGEYGIYLRFTHKEIVGLTQESMEQIVEAAFENC